MSDVTFGTGKKPIPPVPPTPSNCDSVCIDANRIYDSCGAKDCLRDLPLLFTEDDIAIVNNACSVRICKASLITATVDVEPVAFHRGFFAIDMMFYFDVSCDVYTSACSIPTTVKGLAMYGKRVVLYGSEGCAKTFTSEDSITCAEPESVCTYNCNLPKASVQISDPMALSAKLKDCRKPCNDFCGKIPQCVIKYFGGCLAPSKNKRIEVTIGIFTITQLERNVQLLIPSYDFCIPKKECAAKTDDPCEVFSKIEFPTDSFFPPNVEKNDKCQCDFTCNCQN